MRPIKSLKRRAVEGLCGLVALAAGCFVDKDLATRPYVETAAVSDFVGPHGSAVRGQVRQDLVSVNLNDKLSTSIFQNYSPEESAFNCRVFGINYSSPINDNLSVRVGFQYWDYPSGTFGSYDNVIKAGINHSGAIDLGFGLSQLIPNEETESGLRAYLKASKRFQIYNNNDLSISITPSASTAYLSNYNGLTGFSQITPGVNLGIKKKKFGINPFVNQQFGLIPEIKDFTWGGVKIGYKF